MSSGLGDDKKTVWDGDLLDRSAESLLLRTFLIGRMEERVQSGAKGSYVINLDAGWGEGKTYFLKRFQQDLAENHPVAYVNAWEDDHAEDPLIAIMAGISAAFETRTDKAVVTVRKSLLKTTGKVAFVVAKHGLLTLGRRVIGDGMDALAETLGEDGADTQAAANAALEEALNAEAEAAIERFENAKQTIADFKKELTSLVTKHNERKPLFVLIDELDRCRPSYAIALLERVKHLFDIDNIVFVVATDTSQLRHAVSAVYGAGFDGAGYLLRFFDRTYTFAEPEIEPFIRSLFARYPADEHAVIVPPDSDCPKFFALIAKGFKLTLREAERCHDVLRSFITVWKSENTAKIHLIYLLPLIVAYARRDEQTWSHLISRGPLLPEQMLQLQNQKLSWRVSPHFVGTIKEVSVDLSNLLRTFLDLSSQPLISIANQSRTDDWSDWLKDEFTSEVNARPQTFAPGRKAVSSSARYPPLVRSVGRLRSTTDQG